jgi:aryl-alcohol dehydrogenase-like predicted oxidoreductase
VIATKVGVNRADRGPSLSRDTIEEEIEGSLQRLRTDRVDLYYAHVDIREEPLGETLAAFNDLVVSGKVRAIGCSNYRAWRIAEARAVSRELGIAEYCCVQQRHTYLRPVQGASFDRQTSSNEDLLDYCREHPEFRMLAYSPLLKGAYSREDREIPRQYQGPDSAARMGALERVASEVGGSKSQVVYAWMLSGSPAVIPLTAPTTLAQLRENLGALRFSLSAEHVAALDGAGNP